MEKTYSKQILVFGGSSEVIQNVINNYKENILLVLISRNIKKTKEIFKSVPENIDILHYASSDLTEPRYLDLIKKIHLEHKYFDRYFVGYSINRDWFFKGTYDSIFMRDLLIKNIDSYFAILNFIIKINTNSSNSKFIIFIPGWCWHAKNEFCEKCVHDNYLISKFSKIKYSKKIDTKLIHLPPIKTRRNAFCNIYEAAYMPNIYGKKIFKLVESKEIYKSNISAFNIFDYLLILFKTFKM